VDLKFWGKARLFADFIGGDAVEKFMAFYREAYRQQGKEIPLGNALIEQLPVDLADVRQTA
jgi:hypothetical protein